MIANSSIETFLSSNCCSRLKFLLIKHICYLRRITFYDSAIHLRDVSCALKDIEISIELALVYTKHSEKYCN